MRVRSILQVLASPLRATTGRREVYIREIYPWKNVIKNEIYHYFDTHFENLTFCSFPPNTLLVIMTPITRIWSWPHLEPVLRVNLPNSIQDHCRKKLRNFVIISYNFFSEWFAARAVPKYAIYYYFIALREIF